MKLAGQLVAVEDVTAGERAAMFALMDRHYANVSRDVFERHLAEKRWVIRLAREDTGELCGFSTQMLLDVEVDGRPIKALFSGDTIIDRRCWGDHALMLAGGQLAVKLIDEHPFEELYWFLISAGYKTYRFLPVFFRQFYPRYDQPTPPAAMRVLDSLARGKFGRRYARGVVCADDWQYRLRDGIAELSAERLSDPHVRFFAGSNPGHVQGDELCCLARLEWDNFTAAAVRVLGRAGRGPLEAG